MNCKPGDMAVIILDARYAERYGDDNVTIRSAGKVVEVESFYAQIGSRSYWNIKPTVIDGRNVSVAWDAALRPLPPPEKVEKFDREIECQR